MKRNLAVLKPEEVIQAEFLRALNNDNDFKTKYQKVAKNEVKEVLMIGNHIATKNLETKLTVSVLSKDCEPEEVLEEFLGKVAA